MAQLYTVRMNRKVQVHHAGGVVEERLVEEVYHDLPWVTAQRYREKFGEQVISIAETERQPERFASRRVPPATGMGTKPVAWNTTVRSGGKAKAKRAAKTSAPAPAVRNYDAADMVNREMGKLSK
ncbi:hypothetical protein [Inquilinus sp. OTU3971]|uniref:hypothetical protein n=1 Tax=Inquilinus sp. OTU3971 TaxID=3043855 RepID=UPI00313AC489